MIAGGDEMKPPPNSLYRNFTLYIRRLICDGGFLAADIWRQLSARPFCISVLIQHNFAGLILLGIVLRWALSHDKIDSQHPTYISR
jgi:hypothetical protein